MYPNPQDVLPLPERPDLEWYRRQAKDLVKACRRAEESAYTAWAAGLADSAGLTDRLAAFARERLSRSRDGRRCALADAQFVVARAFGFVGWPAFAAHLEAIRDRSAISDFERAAEAIVEGDEATLRALLLHNPTLVVARSTREHRATLLHYVAANGVENYRQRTPANIVTIATMLLDAGAEVDAPAGMYGGGSTTLGLVATSVHPERAGVQLELIDLLLARGARLHHGGAGNRHSLVDGCMANGQPAAARHLAARGAPLDIAGAAGVGAADVLASLLASERPGPGDAIARAAFAYASGYGHANTTAMLLEYGVKPDSPLRFYGERHTGLHVASYEGHVELARLLLAHGASVNARDATWHTTPVTWALEGWSRGKGETTRYAELIALLVASGADVDARHLDGPEAITDPAIRAALRPAD